MNVLKQFGSFNISENKIIGVEATKVVGFYTSTLAILTLIILFCRNIEIFKEKIFFIKENIESSRIFCLSKSKFQA